MIHECADELMLVADMIGSFARSDAGMTRQQAESMARRVRTTAEKLRDCGKPSIGSSMDDKGLAHTPSFRNMVTPAVDGPVKSTGPPTNPRLPAVRPGLASPRVPPAAEHSNKDAVLKSSTANHFSVTKPTSVRVAPVQRESPGSGPSFDASRAAACTLYNMLENITWLMESTTASVYIRDGEEMVSIVNVSPKLTFPPRLLRHACHGSLAAGVLASGIALNQRTVDPRRPPTSTLIVPIYKESSAVAAAPIAVVQVEGKHQGRTAYTESDELTLCFGARLLGLVISRFAMDWQATFHDPISQHNIAPFNPPLTQAVSSLTHAASSEHSEVKAFAEALESFTQQKFIKRVTLPMNHSSSSAPERVVGLGPAPTLKEIDSYVNNLHDCWKKSVEMNVSQSQADRQRAKELKGLREELAQQKAKYAQVADELRIHMLDSSDYKKEYTSLREELDEYLRSKDRMD